MATNLYAGLVTDTGGFRFDNTVPFTFEFAGRLSALGVDTAQVARTTLHRYRREGVALMQRVLATFEYHAEGQDPDAARHRRRCWPRPAADGPTPRAS